MVFCVLCVFLLMLFLSGSLIITLQSAPLLTLFHKELKSQKLQKSKKKAVDFFTPVVFSSNFIER